MVLPVPGGRSLCVISTLNFYVSVRYTNRELALENIFASLRFGVFRSRDAVINLNQKMLGVGMDDVSAGDLLLEGRRRLLLQIFGNVFYQRALQSLG